MLRNQLVILSACVAIAMFAGCGSEAPTFSSNRVFTAKVERETDELIDQAEKDVANVLGALFGSPDEPFMLTDASLSVAEVLKIRNLDVAAGPITRDNYGQGRGLYRQHCVHCHGVTGDGKGPTASFLNPYPRDFRAGKFKFKSTPIGSKPTDEDLTRIIQLGIEGTAMPSFAASLKAGEIDAIVDYVRYLSIRGEMERMLIDFQANENSYEEGEDNSEAKSEVENYELLTDLLSEILGGWQSAEEEPTEIDERSPTYDRWSDEFDEKALAESIERGKKHYYGAGICYQCHGETQLGDGRTNDYDFWTKEYYDWVTNKEAEEFDERLSEYLELGGLPLQNIMPRNLRRGVYRGGRRPIDIYWRIKNGIEGGPMPAANASLLQPDDIWDIVNYVLSLPYEDMSRPDHEAAGYSRIRN